MRVYTHDEATIIVGMFEDILSKYNIHIPSPEDDDRDKDDMVGLYGTTYSNLLDSVEDRIQDIIERVKDNSTIVYGEYSGNI